MNLANNNLLKEAIKVDYTLRSTFFYRKLHEWGFMELSAEVRKLLSLSSNYNWDKRNDWNISSSAWNYVGSAAINPLQAFVHPRVILEQPRLITYYRSLAAISQKGVIKMSFDSKPYENGKKKEIPTDHALDLARLLNTHISLIIDSTLTFSEKDIDALVIASAGAQIQGSWANKIGSEAEAVVRRMLITEFYERDLIDSFINSKGKTITGLKPEEMIEELPNIRGIRLKNQTSVLFGSEPDLSLIGQDGSLCGVIEVKGGKDANGALERFGAAKKSFDEAIKQNPNVQRMFIASYITSEVAHRIQRDPTFQSTFNLTEILRAEEKRRDFLTAIMDVLNKPAI